MSTDWRSERLLCGAELGPVIDQVARELVRRRDPHQRSCRFCQAALEEAAAAWGPVRVLAAEKVVAPEGLVESILRRLQGLAQVGWVTLAGTGRGVTKASAWVVAVLAEVAAERTPGVHRVGSSFGRLAETLWGRLPHQAQDQRVRVDLRVVTVYGEPIPDVSEAIRRNVRSEVAAATGLAVAEINLKITDVEDAEPE